MKNNYDFDTVTKMVSELKQKMRNGTVKFKYFKKNGDIREAVGTLNSDVYGEENKPNGNGGKTPDNQIRYFDVNSNGWRSFLIENFISYDE